MFLRKRIGFGRRGNQLNVQGRIETGQAIIYQLR
jgi:hypothetical protein